MASGTIASLRDRGFGFIMPDGATSRGDLFFHHSAVAEIPFDQLSEGQRVSFDEAPDPRDPSRRRAVNVRLVGELAAE
jgi:CspA family cold shock protein